MSTQNTQPSANPIPAPSPFEGLSTLEQQITAWLTTAQHGSYTTAAERLNTSRQKVHVRATGFETWLDAGVLLHTEPGSDVVTLTPMGINVRVGILNLHYAVQGLRHVAALAQRDGAARTRAQRP